jgi:hypothetical protein
MVLPLPSAAPGIEYDPPQMVPPRNSRTAKPCARWQPGADRSILCENST